MAIPSAGLYLPGILNSRLIAFVFDQSVRKAAPDRQWFSWDDLRNLPVYTPDFDRPEDPCPARPDGKTGAAEDRSGERSAGLQRAIRNARTLQKKIRATDRQIDTLVYDLYGLTADEIAVVEETIGRKDSPIW